MVKPPGGLDDIVGADAVHTDPVSLELYSRDLFTFEGPLALAVVQPRVTDQVRQLVEYARTTRCTLIPRGGGLSYSGGYVPPDDRSIIVDLRLLNGVRQLERASGFLSVEAGATWASVRDALAGTGLRTTFRPPISGSVSTVGGALSQVTVDPMEGILGLEVVTGAGELFVGGSAAVGLQPFFRSYGPDLIGPFLGDAGAFGIKTAATLALEPEPVAVDHASFALDSFTELVAAGIRISRTGVASRVLGLDPVKSRNAPNVGFKEALKTVASIAQRGPASAMGVLAAGRNFMEGVTWSLHVSVEGASTRVVEEALAVARRAVGGGAREISNLLPLALASRPFSVRGFLGPEGERWIATNGVFPHGDAAVAAVRLEEFFSARRSAMQAHGISHSYLIQFPPGLVLLEPSYYWKDVISPLHLLHLDNDTARKFSRLPGNLGARAYAIELRHQLKAELERLGAAHLQLGRSFSYADRLAPGTRRMLDSLKAVLDPDGVLNCGVLGIGFAR